ncbi:hypothetical protein ACFV0B_37795 [Streptomyces xanthophaeus]|uniref:hypothetical protein n=1 Tax=Streptomyces xanthophaeus TaxID=67385 RepID=UPI0036950574
MYRMIRSTAYAALLADRADLDQARTDRDQAHDARERALTDLAKNRTDAQEALRVLEVGMHAVLRQVTGERDTARAEVETARAEVDEARKQVLLDAEDRVALRMLLRTARRQDPSRVHVLFHQGRFHSVHATAEGAEAAAEAEGAPREGWTSTPPGAACPPACEVVWRIQPLTLQQHP